MRMLELFAGIGGISLGAEMAGIETAGFVEIDPCCQKVLKKHWPNVPIWGDIRDVTGEEVRRKIGQVDIVTGGFPCQPFSSAGKRKGEADDRFLWPEMLRVIREVAPRWVVGENVRGVFSIDSGRVFGRILRDLAESGYRVGWVCYGAADVGATHKRERVFILGYSEHNGQPAVKKFRGYEKTSDIRGEEEQEQAGELTGTTRPRNVQGIHRGEPGGEQCAEGNVGGRNPKEVEQDVAYACIGRHGSQKEQICSRRDCLKHKSERPTQPRMGRMSDGISAGVHGDWFVGKWPAGPGEQYEWEPPRIATGVKDRVSRLKALGNAVVPQQIYPIFKAIMEVST